MILRYVQIIDFRRDDVIMWETVSAIKNELANVLNPSAFSMDSFEGWLIIIVGLILIRGFWKKATNTIWWSIGVIFFCQAMYGLSLTGFNDIIPLSYVFKYDVMTSLAQCFVGTKVCDVILYFNSIVIATMNGLWDACGDLLHSMIDNIKKMPDPFPHADAPLRMRNFR